MNILPKNDLIDGAYYEGYLLGMAPEKQGIVARWNSNKNTFEFALWHWSGTELCDAAYWDEESNSPFEFMPLDLTNPRENETL